MIEGFLIVCQIMWYGLGLSLIYDTTERLWHWPHLLVAGLYGGLMLASMALSRRTLMMLGFLTIVNFLLIFIPTAASSNEASQTIYQSWHQMLSGRYNDYFCWGLVMASSVLGGRALAPNISTCWKAAYKVSAVASFILGCAFGMVPYTKTLLGSGSTWNDIAMSQTINFIWLAYWGMPMKPVRHMEETRLSRFFVHHLKLPLLAAILIMGASSYMAYDWAFRFLPLWAQLLWLVVPIVAYFIFKNPGMLQFKLTFSLFCSKLFPPIFGKESKNSLI